MSALLCSLPRSLDGVILYLAKFILCPVEESESALITKFTVGDSSSISRNKACSNVGRGPTG